MADMSPQQAALQAAQQNAGMRAALLGSAPRMRKNVSTVTAAVGTTSRIKLFNVGVLTRLQIFAAINFNVNTAAVVPSAKAPYNLISRARVTDYDGTDRVNLSGFQLYILNSVRTRALYGQHNSPAVPATFTNPMVPSAGTNTSLQFFMDIPLAFDVDNPVVQLQDLRGAILGQTAVGEMYLSIDWNPSFQGADVESVYLNGSGTAVPNGAQPITCTMWQEYLLPQAVGGGGMIPLPATDLMTVYELNGFVRSSDNLAVNTEKLLNYPNLRSVIGIYANYVQAGTLTQGKINGLRVIANGNNILVDNSELSQLLYQRNYMWSDADLTPGAYFRSHREKPIETALFGNVQWGITPNTVGANPYVEIAYESFYTKGQALPGLSQAQ